MQRKRDIKPLFVGLSAVYISNKITCDEILKQQDAWGAASQYLIEVTWVSSACIPEESVDDFSHCISSNGDSTLADNTLMGVCLAFAVLF